MEAHFFSVLIALLAFIAGVVVGILWTEHAMWKVLLDTAPKRRKLQATKQSVDMR